MSEKVALVTGAARGIGLATTKLLIEQGWQVAMVDRDAEALTEAAESLTHAFTFVCDVSSPDQVAAMMQAVVARSGRIDALVNNAGIADFGPLEQTDFARWRRVMETNLDGVFLVSRAALDALKQTRNWANTASAPIASAPGRCAPSWRWPCIRPRSSRPITMRSR